MADPRSMTLDGRTRPWAEVADVQFCRHCLGALPADSASACSMCGPRLIREPAPLVDASSRWSSFRSAVWPNA